MLRPGDVARPAPARTFTTELSWVGSPRIPTSVMTGWLIVIYHRRTFAGWTGSLMGCELSTQIGAPPASGWRAWFGMFSAAGLSGNSLERESIFFVLVASENV